MKKYSDEKLVVALIEYGTIKEAATALSISPRTIFDRMRDSGFRIMYHEARTDILRAAVSSLASHTARALEVVAEIMENQDEGPYLRLQAANILLKHAEKFVGRLSDAEGLTAAEIERDEQPDLFKLL